MVTVARLVSMSQRYISWKQGRVRPRSWGIVLALALTAALGVAVTGCGASVSAGNGGASGGSSAGGGSTHSGAPSPTDSGTWVTVSKSSGASVSSGGGSNSNSSTQSTSINGAYRVIASCQGGGSLELQLNPGGDVNVQCTSSQQAPVRVAGSDSAPPGGQLSITIISHGDITWSDVEAQVRQ